MITGAVRPGIDMRCMSKARSGLPRVAMLCSYG